jgi:hypothetical protein
VIVRSLAAEFPNDNPELHHGVIWVCLAPTGAATAERDVREVARPVPDAFVDGARFEIGHDAVPAPRISGVVMSGPADAETDEPDPLEEPIVVEELAPLDEGTDLEVVRVGAHDDPWTILLSTLADIATGEGAPHVASLLPALLLDGRIEHALSADTARALAEARILDANSVTAAFSETTRAWRAILRGTSDDLTACGGAMLDEWAADLLARLLGTPTRSTALRRELRNRGVAAFGLSLAA